MKLEENLDEAALERFVAERKSDIVEAQNKAITKLKKRKGKKLSDDQDDIDAVKEASVWSQAIKYLREISPELLMPKVLFDKNISSDAYKTPEATAKQRALFQFAADERISTAIQTFREQYPNWKKAKKQLMPKKMDENKGLEINLDQSGVEEKEEIPETPPKKLKKKKKVKAALDSESSNQPQKRKLDATDDVNEEGKLPKKTKKKKKSKVVKNSSAEETNNTETEKENFPSSDTLANPGTKKLNAIEQVVANGKEALVPGKIGSSKKAKKVVKQKGPSHPLPIGKKPKFKKLKQDNMKGAQNNGFAHPENAEGEGDVGNDTAYPRQSNGFQFRNQGRGGKTFHNNRRSRENGNANSPLPPWKVMRFADRNSSNFIEVPADWQNKVIKPKGDDEQKPSLLRPSWLTNPEEYKPIFQGGKNFRRQREPISANKIQVSSDWKNKSLTEENGGDTPTGTSLLKPSWFTNSDESKPASTHKYF